MTNLQNDLCTLTNISENTLKKLIPISTYCIGHAVAETHAERREITEIDLGFGELDIRVVENQIKYRFIPSKELEDCLVRTVTTGCSPIITTLDTKLQEKIDKVYKELI